MLGGGRRDRGGGNGENLLNRTSTQISHIQQYSIPVNCKI